MTRREEILAKAKELGIDHDKRMASRLLVEKIETVLGKAMVFTTADPETPVGKPEPASNMTTTATIGATTSEGFDPKKGKELDLEEEQKEDTVRCIIHSGDRDNDLIEVVGCVNGESYQALIGVEIDFPVKFLPSIKDAVVKEHIHIFDEHGNPTKEIRIRHHKRFIIERI